LVLHILYQGLQIQDLSSVSAESWQKVCTSCQKKMAHHFTILLQIVQAIDSLSISTGAVLEFLKGICLLNEIYSMMQGSVFQSWISANSRLKFDLLFCFVYLCTSFHLKTLKNITFIDPHHTRYL
jgi:hypothetical protein